MSIAFTTPKYELYELLKKYKIKQDQTNNAFKKSFKDDSSISDSHKFRIPFKTSTVISPSPAEPRYPCQLIWICTVCHLVCEFVSRNWIK